WLGAAASIIFLGVMVIQGEICYYCLMAHVGNLGFVGVMEFARRGTVASASPAASSLASWAATFAIGTAALWGAQVMHTKQVAETAERDLGESMQRMVDAGAEAEPFTGRYRLGPADAPIRLVIISGYQCIDCQRIEREVQQLLKQRSDVSLSVKHFPMSTLCNRHMNRNMHSNACWAARAAEAAGIIGGPERFWEMHHWLFERGGSFTDAEIVAGLRELGYDVQRFLAVMQSEETLKLVQQDIEEAVSYGLHYTPMIFINGVELKGWNAHNAVTRAVERVAAAGPQRETAPVRPPTAFEKYIADWKEQPQRAISALPAHRQLAAMEGPVRVDVWGDYETPSAAELDRAVRAAISGRSDVVYAFRYFPIDESCNPASPVSRSEQGCMAARAAEAAGMIGGPEAFRRMHEWLIANHDRLSEAAVRSAAVSMGLDVDALSAAMQSSDVARAVRMDGEMLRTLVGQVRSSTMLFINGKWAPRWVLEGHDVLGAMLDEAAREH
ncbi:MAG TPA: thioredoxin domain-containing protein, partial [Phycisphaerales bacterium]|nr:thioredoxin domain-containing protein [Phycisphaerales bacterium]